MIAIWQFSAASTSWRKVPALTSARKRALATSCRNNLRQLAILFADGRGHFEVCGTATQVVDVMEEWLRTGAADGFNVLPPVLPASLDDFVELVIPELRRRGLVREQYEGRTLRANLGLHTPVARKAAPQAVSQAAPQSVPHSAFKSA